jgi:hypothetical protein
MGGTAPFPQSKQIAAESTPLAVAVRGRLFSSFVDGARSGTKIIPVTARPGDFERPSFSFRPPDPTRCSPPLRSSI